MKTCKCGHNNYEWSVDEFGQSWLKCTDCDTNFFDDGIGVILINWDTTDISKINIEDVVKSNMNNDGIVVNQDEQLGDKK